jgi:threonine/homoserine/homoserine lactone efflux protein
MLTYALALFFLLITPGPGVLSVAGVGSAFGPGAGTRYIAGIMVGTNLVAAAVVFGVAASIMANDRIRLIMLTASLLYLVYLAFRIAFAGSTIAIIKATKAPGFWAGVVLQVVNPKAYAIIATLITGFAFWPENLVAETAIKLLIFNSISVPVHFAWLFVGITFHRLNLKPDTQRRVNMLMAISMLLVVGLALIAPK